MPNITEQFIESNKTGLFALQDVATHAFAGLEKLIALNLATSKASMVESFNEILAILDARDAQELWSLQVGQLQPLALKYVSYVSRVYSIAAETGAEIIGACHDVAENVAKSAPPGAETVAVALNSAVTATQTAIETAQDTAKKAMELVDSQLAAVSHHADNGTTTASRKRS